MAFHQVHLPEVDTPEEALKSYISLERALILEVATKFDEQGTAALGPNWFQFLMNMDNHLPYRNKWQSRWDPTFIFGEIAFIGSSPVRDCLPVGNSAFTGAFDKARRIRNKWAHDFRPRNLTHVLVDAQWIGVAANAGALKVEASARALIQRINSVLNGSWSPSTSAVATPEPVEVPSEATKQFAEDDAEREAEREAFEDFSYERPIVGESWVGPIPTRKLRLQPRLHDVVDDVTGQSIRDELGDLADSTIERWIQIRPSGELFAAEDDGAVLAYVSGRPRLIGYLGPEPEYPTDAVRGFLLPYRFEISGEGVRCLQTDEYLHSTSAQNAHATTETIQAAAGLGIEIRVTTHGDVVRIGDFGIATITRISSETWFPRQLV